MDHHEYYYVRDCSKKTTDYMTMLVINSIQLKAYDKNVLNIKLVAPSFKNLIERNVDKFIQVGRKILVVPSTLFIAGMLPINVIETQKKAIYSANKLISDISFLMTLNGSVPKLTELKTFDNDVKQWITDVNTETATQLIVAKTAATSLSSAMATAISKTTGVKATTSSVPSVAKILTPLEAFLKSNTDPVFIQDFKDAAIKIYNSSVTAARKYYYNKIMYLSLNKIDNYQLLNANGSDDWYDPSSPPLIGAPPPPPLIVSNTAYKSIAYELATTDFDKIIYAMRKKYVRTIPNLSDEKLTIPTFTSIPNITDSNNLFTGSTINGKPTIDFLKNEIQAIAIMGLVKIQLLPYQIIRIYENVLSDSGNKAILTSEFQNKYNEIFKNDEGKLDFNNIDYVLHKADGKKFIDVFKDVLLRILVENKRPLGGVSTGGGKFISGFVSLGGNDLTNMIVPSIGLDMTVPIITNIPVPIIPDIIEGIFTSNRPWGVFCTQLASAIDVSSKQFTVAKNKLIKILNKLEIDGRKKKFTDNIINLTLSSPIITNKINMGNIKSNIKPIDTKIIPIQSASPAAIDIFSEVVFYAAAGDKDTVIKPTISTISGATFDMFLAEIWNPDFIRDETVDHKVSDINFTDEIYNINNQYTLANITVDSENMLDGFYKLYKDLLEEKSFTKLISGFVNDFYKIINTIDQEFKTISSNLPIINNLDSLNIDFTKISVIDPTDQKNFNYCQTYITNLNNNRNKYFTDIDTLSQKITIPQLANFICISLPDVRNNKNSVYKTLSNIDNLTSYIPNPLVSKDVITKQNISLINYMFKFVAYIICHQIKNLRNGKNKTDGLPDLEVFVKGSGVKWNVVKSGGSYIDDIDISVISSNKPFFVNFYIILLIAALTILILALCYYLFVKNEKISLKI